MKLTVLPPDINSGLYRFNVDENGAIVYGIGAIKGVGEALSMRFLRREIKVVTLKTYLISVLELI